MNIGKETIQQLVVQSISQYVYKNKLDKKYLYYNNIHIKSRTYLCCPIMSMKNTRLLNRRFTLLKIKMISLCRLMSNIILFCVKLLIRANDN